VQSAVSVYTEAWPAVRDDARNSVGLPYFRLMFVCQKVVTPGRACQQTSWSMPLLYLHPWISLTVTDYWTNNRVAVTALMVFTHIYSIHTLLKTCRPTRTQAVKVWRCPSRLSHAINVRHWELSSVYYTGLPTRQTPVTAISGRRRQAAYARSCCI